MKAKLLSNWLYRDVQGSIGVNDGVAETPVGQCSWVDQDFHIDQLNPNAAGIYVPYLHGIVGGAAAIAMGVFIVPELDRKNPNNPFNTGAGVGPLGNSFRGVRVPTTWDPNETFQGNIVPVRSPIFVPTGNFLRLASLSTATFQGLCRMQFVYAFVSDCDVVDL